MTEPNANADRPPDDPNEAILSLERRLSALESEMAATRAEIAGIRAIAAAPPKDIATELAPIPGAHRRSADGLRGRVAAVRRSAANALLPAPMFERSPRSRWWDVLAVTALLAIAIPLRFLRLGAVPFGFHGDEAAIGLEALRIWRHGWIGPYSGESGGTPSGPYYPAAIAVHVLGRSVYAARFSSAAFDTLTVVLVYVLARRNFGLATGVIAAFFTAVSIWQLEFARLAFIVSAWPCVVVACAIAFCEAIRRRSAWWWAISGALAAAGLYAYPAHVLLLGVLGIFLVVQFAGPLGWVSVSLLAAAYVVGGPIGVAVAVAGFLTLAVNPRLRARSEWTHVGAFASAFLVVAWPMIEFARHNREVYFRTGRGVSVFDDAEWKGKTGLAVRVWWLLGRYAEFWDRAIRRPIQDGIDGTGAAPMIPALFAGLCAVGIWLAWRRRGQPLVLLSALIVLLLPWAVATSNSFPLRRAVGISPFMAMFAALAVVEIARSAWSGGIAARVTVALALAAVSMQIAYRDLDGYFNRTAASPGMYWTLAGDLVNSVNFMKTLPPGDYVYFYAERWSFDSGERLFLAPKVQGESRGAEFGSDSLAIDQVKGRPVVILIGRFEQLLPVFQMLHPNGRFENGPSVPGTSGQPSFIAFFPEMANRP